ncbi:GntR family transcriptional regulator [Lentzea sp. NBRC 105346]|uniref:GntR family transcriptional regulator n=1 Tax=Lentzea sp. NBRC 105346 TaxID=3032205 RepID=UPI0024A3D1F0|nr:GntR family transcriptional regulator [Lentzea sp. NBRC 105346]GLZ29908.1 GntR family transcriptional regulator [Lentzea sp. NBRC 105346]
MVKGTDGRPRHQQVAAHLRALIMSGELPPGSQLPSTSQLVERYEAANATIQRALTALKDEGFLHSRMGKGVYVRDQAPLTVEAAAYFAPSERGYTYRLLEVGEVTPPVDVAEQIGEAAVMRHRLLLHNDDPVELSWSYYPAKIAKGTPLAGRGKIPGGAPRALNDLGYPQRDFVDRVSARLPTTEEMETLALPDDVPVIRQFRVVYSDDGHPVEVSVLVKGGHMYELQYRDRVS